MKSQLFLAAGLFVSVAGVSEAQLPRARPGVTRPAAVARPATARPALARPPIAARPAVVARPALARPALPARAAVPLARPAAAARLPGRPIAPNFVGRPAGLPNVVGVRPGLPVNRAVALPALANRPGAIVRPNFAVGNRAAIGIGSGAALNNFNTIGVRTGGVNFNRNLIVNPGLQGARLGRPALASAALGRAAWGGVYQPSYYRGWYGGNWALNGPGWWNTPVATGWMLGGVSDPFVNPYYVAPEIVTGPYDYASPVPEYVPQYDLSPAEVPFASPSLPEAATPAPAVDPADPQIQRAAVIFEGAREAFRDGKYHAALWEIDRAIKLVPSDTSLHEFRALTLFAQKNYNDTAGVLYSVLAVGPGWKYETVKALYADWRTYDQQLQDLQAHVDANPKDAASRFVLAYHCLVLNERVQAVRRLNEVVALNPNDSLARSMLQSLGEGPPAPIERPTLK